jgi:glycosyltransferase involved in cell wall biosynthesis
VRILFIDHSSHAAGAAVSLRYLAAELKARGRDVHIGLVWPSSELEAFYASAGVTLHSLCAFPTFPHTTASWIQLSSPRSLRGLMQLVRRYPEAAARLRTLVDTLSPDIVHLNSVTLLPAVLALKHAHARIVWHIRESPPFDGHGWRTGAIARLMKSAAVETIFISHDDQTMWTKGAVGTVVYCCTPTPGGPHPNAANVLRQKLGLAPSDRAVLFVGGFQEIKGFQVLCEAFPLVIQAIPEARLVIIGANIPPPASRLAAIARRYGPYFGLWSYHDQCRRLLDATIPASRRVVKPLVPNVADYLDLCEFLVFPSVRPHFARPVIEAALAGKPSIASNFGGIREVVSEGDGARLVPPASAKALAEAMIAMLRDPSGTRRMGQRAQAFAGQRFTVPVHVDAVERIYARALSNPQNTRT